MIRFPSDFDFACEKARCKVGNVGEASARLAGPAGWRSGSGSPHTLGGEEDAGTLDLQILRGED